MSSFIEAICCCLFPSQASNQRNRRTQNKSKHQKRLPKPSRITSKYPKHTIQIISKQQKLQGVPVYTCPICTCYLNKILACNKCDNTICRKCVWSHEKRYLLSSQNMRCPFCNSEVSLFEDYEREPKKYFDSTVNQKKMNKQNQCQNNKESKYLEKQNKEDGTKFSMKKDEQQTIGIPAYRNELPLKQIHVLNAMRRSNNESYLSNGSSQQMSQARIMHQGNQEQNPESHDLSFIQQFQLRTIEDISE